MAPTDPAIVEDSDDMKVIMSDLEFLKNSIVELQAQSASWFTPGRNIKTAEITIALDDVLLIKVKLESIRKEIHRTASDDEKKKHKLTFDTVAQAVKTPHPYRRSSPAANGLHHKCQQCPCKILPI